MKHASEPVIQILEPLLVKVRQFPGLKEKKAGTFYYKSQAFLHFHEHGDQIFADLKLNGDWVRYEVTHPDLYPIVLAAVQSSF